MKNGKLFQMGIAIVCFLLMLCVGPLTLVRRTVDVTSSLEGPYERTEQYISHETPYVQTFVAQYARLNEIEFVVGYSDAALEGQVLVELLNERDEVLASQLVNAEEIKDYNFCRVSVKRWLKTGKEYKIRISVEDGLDNKIYGVYTTEPDKHALGSNQFYIGDSLISGQATMNYRYGVPLNAKNIICLWAFLVTIALAVGSLAASDERREKANNKFYTVYNRLWTILERWQIPILILEICLIFLMITFISRNKTVDWDEAYSIQIITKYSFGEMIQVTANDIHPPLYYIFLRLFASVFGTGISTLKMMSVFFSVCVMLLSITMVRKNWGFCAAFLFNLVVGLGPAFLFYSLDIRMYSLALFFVMWCALLAYEIINKNRKIYWILFVLSALGGVYTHYFTAVPLAFIYCYLLAGLFLWNRKECKKFIAGCVVTILAYLPWLFVMIRSFEREGTTGHLDVTQMNFRDLLEWSYSTNIELSVYMPIVLFFFAVLLLFFRRKQYTGKDILFLVMCGVNFFFSYVVCRLIATLSDHFWDNRYVFAALGLFWLFLVILYSDQRKEREQRAAACVYPFGIWLIVIVLSSFTIQKAKELGTNEYMDATYQVLEQVRNEKTILYNYATYDVLYSSHLREQEFVFIDDVDWDNLDQDYIYMISWGGQWFDEPTIEKYGIEVQYCGTMRFEEGVAGVELYKILIGGM